jgi:SAM-dependent methyltransferase
MITKLIKQNPLLYSMALYTKHSFWRAKTKKAFARYINHNKVAKLQLGAGANELDGWFNTDYFARKTIFFLDATKKFPFDDNSFEWVFSEHHIEHITYKQAQTMLAEIFRTMKPGGYLRIDTPDLKKYVANYIDNSLKASLTKQHAKDWIYSGFAYAANYIPVNDYYNAHFLNDIFLNYEHRFIYDFEALKALLEATGFVNVIQLDATKSLHDEFKNIASHQSDFDYQFALYTQAQKPA